MRRQFSEAEPELMDLPAQDPTALRNDLVQLSGLNKKFGARRAVASLFRRLAGGLSSVTLIDLASGYGDHGRNILRQARERGQDARVVAIDFQLATLQIARSATPPGEKMFFVQADARQLPLRSRGADLAFCSLALHHFSCDDATRVLTEMKRVSRVGTACVDLARSRLAVIGIWLLTTFIIRDPMVRHDARVSVRRAFTLTEMRDLVRAAGWVKSTQAHVLCFQQAVTARST